MAEPESPRVLDSLALAYFLSGEPGLAARTQRRALALLPADDADLRGELETKLERYVEAARDAGIDVEEGEGESS